VQRDRAIWLFGGALAACAVAVAGASAQPTLRISDAERTWDLADQFPGGIAVGQIAEHEFLVENAGTEPLEITEAKPKNEFLTTVLPGKKIAPGESAPLQAVFSAKGLEPGRIETYIVVKSNDPASAARPVVLTVKAQVIPRPETLLVVQPQERDIGLVRVGRPETLAYTYENAGSEEFEIYPLYFIDRRFQIVTDIEREVFSPGASKKFELRFTPRPEDENTELNAVFVVRTGAEKQPRVVCRVRGYVAPAEEGVQIVPKYFGGEKAWYVFRIVNNTDRAVEVVAMRGGETIKSLVVQAENHAGFEVPVASEEELNEISFQVNLDYKPPAASAETAETAAPAEVVAPEGEEGEAASEAPEPTETEAEPADPET